MRFVRAVGLVAILSVGVLAQANPVPFLMQPLVPTSVAPGGPALTLTISGTGFVPTSLVNWNGSPLLTTVVSGTKLTAKVPASRIREEGNAWITVTNPGGLPSNTIFFSVAAAAPVLAFEESQVLASGTDVSVGDFDGDGVLDILSGGRLQKGKGDGTFGPAISEPCGGFVTTVGDFNGDGRLDIITGTYDFNGNGSLFVCLGRGNGKFTSLPVFSAPDRPRLIVVGDFNLDGKLDIAVDLYNYDTGVVTLGTWMGRGDGTFDVGPVTTVENEINSESTSMALGDLNGDGILDAILAIGDRLNSVGVLLGNGDGTFKPAVFYPLNRGPEYVAVGDLNGDGKPDLAVTQDLSNTLSIFLGTGDGTFQTNVDYETGAGPEQVVMADVDRDGVLDVAFAEGWNCIPECSSGAISIMRGNGDGTLKSPVEFPSQHRFLALALGDFNGDGRLDFFAPASIFLQGSDEPNVNLSPTSLTFGDQDVGSPSAPQTVTLTNTGTGDLVITGFSFAGANLGDFTQTNDCGTGVAGGGSCTIQVSFAPTATGARAAILQVSDNAPGSPQSVTLAGTGVAPAVTLSSSSLTFPTTLLGVVSASQTVTLTNTGTGPLTLISIAAQGDFLEQNNCGTSVAAGGSCTITVQFKPLHKDTRTGAVVITDNAPDSPQSVALTGVGTVVRLSAIGINFGNQKVGTSNTSVIRLTNVRDQPLNISGIDITGTNAGDFSQVNTCGAAVPGHGSCKIRVTFSPTVTGSRSATLSLSDDGGGSPQTVALSGTGT